MCLQEGLVIVDTPGIGGDGHMCRYAEQYLTKSYGFIYVVNSANAGGVQKGRVSTRLTNSIQFSYSMSYNTGETKHVDIKQSAKTFPIDKCTQ